MSEIIKDNSILDIINDINTANSIREFNFLFGEIIEFIKYIDKNKRILNKEGYLELTEQEMNLLQECKNKVRELEQIFIPDLFNIFIIYLHNLTNINEIVVFNKNLLLFLYSIIGCETDSKQLFKLNIISDKIDDVKEKSKKEIDKINELVEYVINCIVFKTASNMDTLECIIENLLNDLICLCENNKESDYDYTVDYFSHLLKIITKYSIGNSKLLKKILKTHDILWEYQENCYEYDEFYKIYKEQNYYSDDICAIFVYNMIDYPNYKDILKEIYEISKERNFLNTLNIIYCYCDNEEIQDIFELEKIEDIQKERLNVFNLCFENKYYIKIKHLIKQSTYLSQKERELVFNEVLDRIKCLPNIIDFKTYFYFIKHSLKDGKELIELFPKNEQYSQFNKFDIIKPLYNNDFQNADVLNYVLNSDLIKSYFDKYTKIFLVRSNIIDHDKYKDINIPKECIITNDLMYKWLNNLMYISQNEEKCKMNNYYMNTIISNLFIFINKFSNDKINDFFTEIDEKINFINIENYKLFTNKVFNLKLFKQKYRNKDLKINIAFNLIKNSTKYTDFEIDYNNIFNDFIKNMSLDEEEYKNINFCYNNLIEDIKKSRNSIQVLYSRSSDSEEFNEKDNKIVELYEKYDTEKQKLEEYDTMETLNNNFDEEIQKLEEKEKKQLKRGSKDESFEEVHQAKKGL